MMSATTQRLIRDVFAELTREDPGDLRDMSLRLADAVSFLHVRLGIPKRTRLKADSSQYRRRAVRGPQRP